MEKEERRVLQEHVYLNWKLLRTLPGGRAHIYRCQWCRPLTRLAIEGITMTDAYLSFLDAHLVAQLASRRPQTKA
ncbi:hypothetical protein ES708_28121 [subsurface metagenome]|jgi:hypothetical protein